MIPGDTFAAAPRPDYLAAIFNESAICFHPSEEITHHNGDPTPEAVMLGRIQHRIP